MIRELTKSALSFSWALSLLGVTQAVNLGKSGQNGGDLFAPMAQTAVGQLDESMKAIYRSGDSFGSRAVDLAFTCLNPVNWLNPSSWGTIGNWASSNNWTRSVMNFTDAATGCGCSTPGTSGMGGTQSASTGSAPANGADNSGGGACGWGPPRN